MGLKKYELIDLDKSLAEAELSEQIEEIKKDFIKWTKEERDLKEKYIQDPNLEKTEIILDEMKPIGLPKIDDTFLKNGGLLVGFDESSTSRSGTYAKLSCFKFGESQVSFEDAKYKYRNYMYEPLFGYIEDSYQKIKVYTSAIENFVKNLEEEFKGSSLETSVEEIRKWFERIFPRDTQKEWDKRQPTIGIIIDRIRTADELLCTIFRMKQIKDEFPNREIIFLGDGIAAFRPHYFGFPSSHFIRFFKKFLKEYQLNYYTFSKVCRLRDKKYGTLIAPTWSKIIEEDPFVLEVPQDHSNSNSHLVRMIKIKKPVLRFDVPKNIDLKGTIEILKKITPFSPIGYPLALKFAHEASSLTELEKRILFIKYKGSQEDPRTKSLITKYRKQLGV